MITFGFFCNWYKLQLAHYRPTVMIKLVAPGSSLNHLSSPNKSTSSIIMLAFAKKLRLPKNWFFSRSHFSNKIFGADNFSALSIRLIVFFGRYRWKISAKKFRRVIWIGLEFRTLYWTPARNKIATCGWSLTSPRPCPGDLQLTREWPYRVNSIQGCYPQDSANRVRPHPPQWGPHLHTGSNLKLLAVFWQNIYPKVACRGPDLDRSWTTFNKTVQLTNISLDLRVRLDPSILTATTTDPDPNDLNTTSRVTVSEHSLQKSGTG